MELLPLRLAARRLGVHTDTLRRWENAGRIPCIRSASGQRKFIVADLDKLLGIGGAQHPERREALYCRISGRGDQKSSLAAQEEELRRTATGTCRVFRDIGSGLSERRRGLSHLLDAVARGEIDVVRVTHRDRLARFGTLWLERLLGQSDCQLEVLHGDITEGTDELLSDFMALVASFAGRMYGMRGAATKKRLLERVAKEIDSDVSVPEPALGRK